MKNRSCSRGFSLIELLIAGVVVASAGALLAGGLVSANRGTDLYAERALATQLLASQLALLDGPVGQGTPEGGDVPSLGDGWSWTQRWQPSAFAPLQDVTVTVTHNAHATHVVTYRPLAEP